MLLYSHVCVLLSSTVLWVSDYDAGARTKLRGLNSGWGFAFGGMTAQGVGEGEISENTDRGGIFPPIILLFDVQ